MILVTGAGGQVGCSVIRALSARGLDVRAFVHREETAEKVLGAGAKEVFVGDMTCPEDLTAAFRGIDTVYYICSAQNPAEDVIGRNMIRIARSQPDVYFVYHSVLHSLSADMPHHEKKQQVEKMLVDSGLMYAVVQPAVFMQMLTAAVRAVKNGGPAPQKFFTGDSTRMNFLDLRDFAEAAAIIIGSRDYAYGTYELAGPRNCSRRDLEEAFTQAAGRPVSTVYLEDAVFLERSGNPPDTYSGKTLLKMFAHYNAHGFQGNDRVFRMITGRKPRTVTDFIRSCME